MSNTYTIKTLKLRLKDKHSAFLRGQSRAVNMVWNYCNELCLKHWQRKREFFSAYDIHPYTKGAGKELGLHSQTLQAIQEEYVLRRKQVKKVKLRWRKSNGSGRSLGWIPFKASALRYKSGQVWYCGKALSLWDSYGLAEYELGTGSFNEDSRGRWYINITVKIPTAERSAKTATVGIDLGLKDFCVTSDGLKIESHKFYRDLEVSLGIAQRANKKKKVKSIHVKIKNRRRDALHKLSTMLVNEYGAIFVGNVNAYGLAKTKMAKSVLDAGWGMFRTMLSYKSDYAGIWFEEVNESYSTQTCSCCGLIPDSSPKGRAGLGIREWTCSFCGESHDRDINAARNILAVGHNRLAGGIPAL